ncbi:MAG: hypothetical protein AAFN41_12370 [Planctomycetota bacterium]
MRGLSYQEIHDLASRVTASIEASDFEQLISEACQLPVFEHRSFDDRFENDGVIRRTAQYLDALARYRWAVGDRDAANSYARHIATLADGLEADERQLSWVVAYAIRDLYFGWLRRRLERNELGADDALFHVSVLRNHPIASPGQSSDRYLVSTLTTTQLPPEQLPNLSQDEAAAYRDGAVRLGHYIRQSVDTSPAYRLTHTNEAGDDWWNLHLVMDPDSPYTREFDALGGVSAVVAMENSYRNELRSLETALAITIFIDKNGVPPDTLAQLVPEYLAEVPRDAYDGSALRYEAGLPSMRYRLYSVGWDGVDDGGKPDPGRANAARLAPGGFDKSPDGTFDYRLDPWAPE